MAFYLEHGFQETAVTTGALPGYRVFALPRQPRDLGKRMLPISTVGMEQGVLHIPQNPLCHLSLWSASQMGVAARQLGVAVREWDFTAGWPLPAPVAMLAGKPIVDLDHRVLDAQEAMALLRGAA